MQEELSNYKSLVDSVGWKKLMEVADNQLKLRMPSVLEKVENFLALSEKEFEKGEMAGINLFMQLPGIAIDGLKEDIDRIEKDLGYDREERTSGSDGDGDAFEPAI